jgi:hypothetical protein
MSDPSPTGRTFDREEVALILREAAQRTDTPDAVAAGASLMDGGSERLTLTEIERAAAEVGIARSAVVAASLSVALRGAHIGTERFHVLHEFAGELSEDALDRIVSELRSQISPSSMSRTGDGLDFEVGSANGAPGSLLVQLRSKRGATTMELWSRAPSAGVADLVGWGFLGVCTSVFTAVASVGGHWHAPEVSVVASAGAAMGAGVGAGVQQWRLRRWRADLARIIVPLSARIAALTQPSDTRLPSELS